MFTNTSELSLRNITYCSYGRNPANYWCQWKHNRKGKPDQWEFIGEEECLWKDNQEQHRGKHTCSGAGLLFFSFFLGVSFIIEQHPGQIWTRMGLLSFQTQKEGTIRNKRGIPSQRLANVDAFKRFITFNAVIIVTDINTESIQKQTHLLSAEQWLRSGPSSTHTV